MPARMAEAALFLPVFKHVHTISDPTASVSGTDMRPTEPAS